MLTFVKLNPEYEYRFFDKNQRRSFIKEFFTERILEAYDTLVPGAFQADLFRYCYLFKHGGCYFDLKIICRKPLRNMIKPTDTFLVCMDYESSNSIDRQTGTSLLNSMIMTTRHNPLLYQMIETCAENILDKQNFFLELMRIGNYGAILDLTGPTLFYRTVYNKLSPQNIRFKHIIQNRDETYYKNFQIVDIDTKELVLTKTSVGAMNTYIHYSDLWKRMEVFYRNRQVVGENVIYVYPHQYNDVFLFEIDDNKITAKRECGWALDLKIKIARENRDEFVHIGTSPHAVKTISLDKLFKSSINSTVNYAIATFPGRTMKRDRNFELSCLTVDLQLAILYKIFKAKITLNIPNLVKQITIGIHRNGFEEYPNYYKIEKWKNAFSEFPDLKFVVKEYPIHKAVSYSQWINIAKDFPSYDYTILCEDDISISPTNINFDLDLVELYKNTFPEGKGYLCSRKELYPSHASVSTGIISTKSISELTDPLSCVHDQISFSSNFEKNGIRIEDMTDHFKVLFYDEFYDVCKDLSKPGVIKEMFVANQYIEKRLTVDIDTFLNPF